MLAISNVDTIDDSKPYKKEVEALSRNSIYDSEV
jgi:hypothetical protein